MNSSLSQNVTTNPRFRKTYPDPEPGQLSALTSGTRIRITLPECQSNLDGVPLPLEGLLYWMASALGSTTFRLDSWDENPGVAAKRLFGVSPVIVLGFDVVEEGPEPPFCWPDEDLKNLVRSAPTAAFTRALLRIKYNKPLPPEAVTFEAIEEFLATLPPPPVAPAKKSSATIDRLPSPTIRRRSEEIRAGDYVTVEGTRQGYTNTQENWTRSGAVEVPLSVFEEGEDAVEEYVQDKVDEMDLDYGHTESGEDEWGEFEIDTDLSVAIEEAEAKIAERDGTDEEDEEDEEDED